MNEVVIVNPVRTPIGSFGGALRSVAAFDLACIVMKRVLRDTAIDPDQISDAARQDIAEKTETAPQYGPRLDLPGNGRPGLQDRQRG